MSLVDSLWKRMAENGDLPVVRAAVTRVTELTRDHSTHYAKLEQAILDDYAMTQRLLKLANSAMYRTLGGEVSSVSQAIQVLGLEAVRHLALRSVVQDSLSRVGTGPDSAHVLARANLAGGLARGVAGLLPAVQEEEAALYALLDNTGAVLVSAFLPEAWEQVRALSLMGTPEQDAASLVLGMSLAGIGAEAVKRWGLPLHMAQTLTSPLEGLSEAQRVLRTAAAAANHAASAVSAGESPEQAFAAAAKKHGPAMGLASDSLSAALNSGLKGGLLAQAQQSKPAAVSPQALAKAGTARLKVMQRAPGEIKPEAVLSTVRTALGLDRAVLFFANSHGDLVPRHWTGDIQPESTLDMCVRRGERSIPSVAVNQDKVVFIEHASEMAANMPGWHASLCSQDKSLLFVPGKDGTSLLYGAWGTQVDQASQSVLTETRALLSRLAP